MKHFRRFLLLLIGLAIGGGLGYVLLVPDFKPIKMVLFLILCGIFGNMLHKLDKRLSK